MDQQFGRLVESTQAEQQKEKRMKRNEDRLRELWNIKHPNVHIMEPQKKRKRKGWKTSNTRKLP